MSVNRCTNASLSALPKSLWDAGHRFAVRTVGIGQDEMDSEQAGRGIQGFIGCKVQIEFLLGKFRKLFHLVWGW